MPSVYYYINKKTENIYTRPQKLFILQFLVRYPLLRYLAKHLKPKKKFIETNRKS